MRVTRPTSRSLAFLFVMVLLANAAIGPARAQPGAVPGAWASGAIVGAERGAMGCVVPVDAADNRRICIVTHADGPDVSVLVAVFKRAPKLNFDDPARSEVIRSEAPAIFEAVLPATSLTATGPWALRLQGTVEGVGDLDVSFYRHSPQGNGISGCPGYPIMYDVQSTDDVSAIEIAQGTIGASPVQGDRTLCGAVFFRTSYGAWAMPVVSVI